MQYRRVFHNLALHLLLPEQTVVCHFSLGRSIFFLLEG